MTKTIGQWWHSFEGASTARLTGERFLQKVAEPGHSAQIQQLSRNDHHSDSVEAMILFAYGEDVVLMRAVQRIVVFIASGLLAAAAAAAQVNVPAANLPGDTGINWATLQAPASPSLADAYLAPPALAQQALQQQKNKKPNVAKAESQVSLPEQQVGTAKSAIIGSPKHIFFVIPAYGVDYLKHAKPLSPHEKFQEFEDGAVDPLGLAYSAAEAALEHSKVDGFCGYGSGLDSYSKCYGSALLDADDSALIGDYLLPVWWHQDPRYFRLGEGSFGSRVWYAFSRMFITRTDNGTWAFASAALTGTVVAAGISNLYYPHQDRGWGLTMSRVAWDLGATVIFNEQAEFWPDIESGLKKVF